LHTRELVVEEDVASGAQIFSVPRPLISGARSYMGDMSLVKLRAHDLVLYRVSCPLDPGYSRDIRGRRCHWVPGWASRVGCTSRALMILTGSDRLISLEPF
jgi:hypothetical protein